MKSFYPYEVVHQPSDMEYFSSKIPGLPIQLDGELRVPLHFVPGRVYNLSLLKFLSITGEELDLKTVDPSKVKVLLNCAKVVDEENLRAGSLDPQPLVIKGEGSRLYPTYKSSKPLKATVMVSDMGPLEFYFNATFSLKRVEATLSDEQHRFELATEYDVEFEVLEIHVTGECPNWMSDPVPCDLPTDKTNMLELTDSRRKNLERYLGLAIPVKSIEYYQIELQLED